MDTLQAHPAFESRITVVAATLACLRKQREHLELRRIEVSGARDRGPLPAEIMVRDRTGLDRCRNADLKSTASMPVPETSWTGMGGTAVFQKYSVM